MITYQIERLGDCLGEAMGFLPLHWKEAARHQDTIALSPDFNRYDQLEQKGNLLVCTARYDGILIGYLVQLIDWQLHYAKTRWAEADIYWVKPEYRGQGIWKGMVAFCEAEMAKRGTAVSHIRVKLDNPGAAKALVGLGYEPIEVIYSKALS